MIKHKDLIEIDQNYRPVFTLGQQESEKYWKSYIPHPNFLEFLNKVLNVVEGKEKRTSIWLQGSYGVGKSHACSVVAHLLSDPWEEIKDYVENDIQDRRLIGRLKNLRENKKFIPVYVIGTEDVPALDFMTPYIKYSIARKLESLGVPIPVLKSEINTYVELIKNEDEKRLLEDFIEYTSKEAIIKDLKKEPPDEVVLKRVYEYFLKFKGIHLITNFKEWIKQVNKLIKEYGYDGILLIWDEFTQILDVDLKYLEKLQNLLAESPDLYLIIVSHRTADFYKRNYDEQTLRKVADRFVPHKLELAEVTVFQILKRAIRKKNADEWNRVRNEKYANLSDFVKSILNLFEEQKPSVKDIIDLYPLHPFTVLLATVISEEFFSSSRSLFGYLFDENGVLKQFLEKDVDSEPFLTADTLWDYFAELLKHRDYGDFAKDILTHYATHIGKVKELGEDFVKVFKTLLIFNLLYKALERPKLYSQPTEENVKLAYAGTPLEGKVKEILEKINSEGILQKTPDGKFLILSSALPLEELKEEERNLELQYKEVSKIIADTVAKQIRENFSKELLRKLELHIVPPNEAYRYKVKPSHLLQVVLGFYKTPSERYIYEELFEKASKEEANVVFLIWGQEFGEYNFKEWIKWKARERVADRHKLESEREYSLKMANKVLEDFLGKDTYLTVYFRGEAKKISKKEVSIHLRRYSELIFEKGPEKLGVIKAPLWKQSSSKLLTDILTAQRIEDIERIINKGPEKEFKQSLYDSDGTLIFNKDLSLNPNADPYHPIVALSRELEEKFRTSSRISLRPENFYFLRYPPYGLYDNKVSIFMLGLAIKPFQNRLYKLGTGKASVSDIAEFLNRILHEKNKKKITVELRYGSEIEDKLANLLKDLFENFVTFSKKDDDLIRIRNTIRENLLKLEVPLWMLAHLDDKDIEKATHSNTEDIRTLIRELSKFIASGDTEFEEDKLRKLYSELDRLKIGLKPLLTLDNLLTSRRRFIERKLGSRKVDKAELGRKLREHLSSNPNFWDEGEVSALVDRLIEEFEKKKLEQERLKETQDLRRKETLKQPEPRKMYISHQPTTISKEQTNKASPHKGFEQFELVREFLDLEKIIQEELSESELRQLVLDILRYQPELRIFLENWLRDRGYA